MKFCHERVTAEEYIDFLKRTDLGSQYPKERFEERIGKLVKNVAISVTAREENGELIIHNLLEDRKTVIKNCVAGEVITMDYPVIQSTDSSHNINIQNDFNWKFFRIANTYENRKNDLTVSIPCTIKIKYSPIVKVGL